jgi:hypothetical protein
MLVFAGLARADMYPDGSNAKLPTVGTPAASACVDAGGKLLSQVGGCAVDVRSFGAVPDAVLGPVGSACSGITGADNTAALQAAINQSMTTGAHITADGPGIYRINSPLKFDQLTVNYFANYLKGPNVDFKVPIVYCGNNAAFHFLGEMDGARIHIAQLIGPGAGSSAPTPGSHAENVGLYFEGAAWMDISIDQVMDFTYDILFDGAYGNHLDVGSAIASYKAIYLRDGAPGTYIAGGGSGANVITIKNVGGPYAASTDSFFAARQARSSFRGIQLGGGVSGNSVIGGAIQYSTKPGAVNLEVDSDNNFLDVWVEGFIAGGGNVAVTGSNNVLRLSALFTPSTVTGSDQNVSVTGSLNTLYAPTASLPGFVTVAVNNFINGNAALGNYTPTVACSVGAPTTATATARYRRIGAMIWVEATWNTANIGTCATGLLLSLPPGVTLSTTNTNVFTGINMTSGSATLCKLNAATPSISITTPTGGFPAANGQNGLCSGWFDVE